MAVFNMIGAGSSGGGGSGTDTSDATAYAENIQAGYTAYARGLKLTGTLSTAFLRFRSRVLPKDSSCPEATTYNLTIPADAVNGDLIVACIMHRDTITPPPGFILVATQLNSDFKQYTSMYYKICNNDASSTITFTQATSVRLGIALVIFEVVDGAVTLDTYGSTTNTSSPLTFPPLTATKNRSVCICVSCGVYSGNAITFNGINWKTLDITGADQRIGVAYEYVSAGAVAAASIVYTTSPVTCSTVAAVFKLV